MVKNRIFDSFKYLGHIICNSSIDDADITNMIIRTNKLSRKFYKCTIISVKIVLFRSCCICLYDVALWNRYHMEALNKLRPLQHIYKIIFFWFLPPK